MRVFATLARTGSLASAARVLQVNHVTVGRRVAALESALGAPLVDRSVRNTTLTAKGIAVARIAEQMEALAGSIVDMTDGDSALAGTIKLRSPPVLAGAFLIPRLAPFRTMHPNLNVTVTAVPSLAALEADEADLSIRLVRPDRPANLLRRLGSMSFGLYAAPEVAETEAEHWTFIGYDGELDHMTQQRWLSDYAGYRPTLFRTTDMFGQLAAVRAGLGVALLPRFIAEETTGLVRLDPGATPPRRSIWLSLLSDVQKSPAVRALADHLEEAFAASEMFSAAAND